jgi:hypothetical protein
MANFECGLNLEVEGIAEEDWDDSIAEKLLKQADSYMQYPSWVKEGNVAKVRGLKCFETVREMLLNGIPAAEVARHIQHLNELTDTTHQTVRVYVEHYKATLPKTQMLARMVPTQYLETKAAVDKRLDCLAALEELHGWMKKRIQIGMRREESMDFLMPNMEKNFSVMLEIIAKTHEVKKDLIGDQKQIAEDISKQTAVARIDWNRIYESPNANELMNNVESRARLVRFSQTLSNVFGKLTPEQQKAVAEAAAQKVKG